MNSENRPMFSSRPISLPKLPTHTLSYPHQPLPTDRQPLRPLHLPFNLPQHSSRHLSPIKHIQPPVYLPSPTPTPVSISDTNTTLTPTHTQSNLTPSPTQTSGSSTNTSTSILTPHTTDLKGTKHLNEGGGIKRDESILKLYGLQPPVVYPGTYPEDFIRHSSGVYEKIKGPEEKVKRSLNPWDYTDESEGTEGVQRKPRRAFSESELEFLEVLWTISSFPNKYDRQRVGAWLGVATRHINVWFQNRRQELKNIQNRNPRPSCPTTNPEQSTSSSRRRHVDETTVTPSRIDYLKRILRGDYTRDRYFTAAGIITQTISPSHPRMSIDKLITINSTSSSQISTGSSRGSSVPIDIDSRKRTKESELGEEERKRNEHLISLMKSSPPDREECFVSSQQMNIRVSQDNNRQGSSLDGDSLLLTRPSFGRATSHDLIISSQRAKQLLGRRNRFEDIFSLKPVSSVKRDSSVSAEQSSKRVRTVSQVPMVRAYSTTRISLERRRSDLRQTPPESTDDSCDERAGMKERGEGEDEWAAGLLLHFASQ
ncbi:hypothetical protein TREMEDRAFT_60986 [Tremella mesenterica DSM 1558]|uniref:uncharacterized protein n=1 Tax=Tremella mesenterica (strain ATCC 24925 / CBS 8224 / DSM 1558 / NBRC 9311 / NRRL Y-6157 / RJB 2259-6 / UBC 559-6) TaxID=578456 RepID=UPI0003F4948D|nr:uncharacterized protein TREMEDRAFT_60986 [Tremella mesenterica DSM 1558]EIW70482.1 hypothetical protein TREMEDRAFT_60986 [Tremella mesenterica DSM 1558]